MPTSAMIDSAPANAGGSTGDISPEHVVDEPAGYDAPHRDRGGLARR